MSIRLQSLNKWASEYCYEF